MSDDAEAELLRIAAALRDDIIKRSQVMTWLETPNPAFEGRTPAQVVQDGEAGRLWQAIHLLRSGEPS